MASALQELVVFVQDAGIARRGGASFAESLKGASGVVQHIEVSDAQVAPGSSEGRFKRNGALPHHDGFGVAAAVVQEVAKIVGCMRITRICLDRFAEQNEFFEATGKDIRRICAASAFADMQRSRWDGRDDRGCRPADKAAWAAHRRFVPDSAAISIDSASLKESRTDKIEC